MCPVYICLKLRLRALCRLSVRALQRNELSTDVSLCDACGDDSARSVSGRVMGPSYRTG
jgi:hypothetical protein